MSFWEYLLWKRRRAIGMPAAWIVDDILTFLGASKGSNKR